MKRENLIHEIALWALNHSYLHLGEHTLLEMMGEDLGVNDEQLKEVEKYLNSLLGETE